MVKNGFRRDIFPPFTVHRPLPAAHRSPLTAVAPHCVRLLPTAYCSTPLCGVKVILNLGSVLNFPSLQLGFAPGISR